MSDAYVPYNPQYEAKPGSRWADPRSILPTNKLDWDYIKSLESPKLVSVEYLRQPWDAQGQWYACAGWDGALGHGHASSRRQAMQSALWHVFLYQIIGQHIPCGQVPSFYRHLEDHPVPFI